MQGSQQYAVNLYRTAVSPGVYPVTIATTSGNLDDTLFPLFPIMRGTPAVCGCSKGTFAGYRLYTDKSNPAVGVMSSSIRVTTRPNSVWYWSYVTVLIRNFTIPTI